MDVADRLINELLNESLNIYNALNESNDPFNNIRGLIVGGRGFLSELHDTLKSIENCASCRGKTDFYAFHKSMYEIKDTFNKSINEIRNILNKPEIEEGKNYKTMNILIIELGVELMKRNDKKSIKA